MIERISILGCGWYGLPMAKKLIENGYDVKGSTTSEAKLKLLSDSKIKGYVVNFDGEHDHYNPDFFDCELLLISIPPKSKSPELKNFQVKINSIISAAQQHQIKQLIFISSTGIYQDGNLIVDETIDPIPDTELGNILLGAENSLRSQEAFTTTIIRFAGLIGPNRNLARHFAGREDIPNGLAPINLIHLTDCIGITSAIIDQEAFGRIYHGVAPSHPTRNDFYTKACADSGFAPPSFLKQLLNWKQIESVNVSRILSYQFSVSNWQLITDS